jgi:hypothetical protein
MFLVSLFFADVIMFCAWQYDEDSIPQSYTGLEQKWCIGKYLKVKNAYIII